VLLALPWESYARRLGSGHFEKILVVFVGRPEAGICGWKEEKSSNKTG